MAGFLDRMVGNLNKGVNTVSENSKFILEKTKINSRIQDINNDNKKLFYCIGELIYNLYKSEDVKVEQCEEMCSAINENNVKINELKAQIELLEKQKNEALQPKPIYAESISGGIECSCGHINKPGAVFCGNCGNKLETGTKAHEINFKTEADTRDEIPILIEDTGTAEKSEKLDAEAFSADEIQKVTAEIPKTDKTEVLEKGAENISSGVIGGKKCVCGYINNENSKFCGSCGAKLGDEKEKNENSIVYIKCSCGYTNKADSKFCGNCGKSL